MNPNETYIPMAGAIELMNMGHRVVHVRHWLGSYFLVKTPWDPDFTDRMKEVPSWTWIKEERAWKIHYLDLPTFEAVCFANNYSPRYDPSAAQILRGLKEDYLGRREWKQNPLVEIPALRRFRDYQIIGAQFMFKAKRVLNADGMGAGKTAQTIGAILLNKHEGNPYKTLVIAPSSMKGAWKKEIEKVTNELRAVVLDSSMAKRYKVYEQAGNYDVLIISYEGFVADYDDLPNYFQPNIIVIDECHRIANRQNKITQALIGGKNIKKTFPMMCPPHSVYLLTGTPINNKMEDLYALLKFIDPGIFSWTGFCNRYAQMEEGARWLHSGGVSRPQKFRKIVGYKNEKELKAKLSLHMIRRTKDEILPELPPKTFEVVEVELDAEERKIYNDLRDEYRTTIRGTALEVTDALTWMTRAQQIANSLETVPGSGTKKSSKLEELVRIVNEQAPSRKIIIFSKFKAMTTIIERELRHHKPLHLNGDTPAEERTEMIEQFQTDIKNRVFISTIKAGGVGITLTAADLVIFYDIAYTPAANAQAADRAHRLGQTNPVLVITLCTKDTIDERLFEICMVKQETVDEMIGDEASVMARLTTHEQAEVLI